MTTHDVKAHQKLATFLANQEIHSNKPTALLQSMNTALNNLAEILDSSDHKKLVKS